MWSGLQVLIAVCSTGFLLLGIVVVLASIGMSGDIDTGGHVWKSGLTLLAVSALGFASLIYLFFWPI